MKLSEIVKSFNFQREFAQQLIQEVLNLAKKYPNFIYNPTRKGYCVYNGPAKDINKKNVGPQCKGCIFGQALQNMGWNDADEMIVTYKISTILKNCIYPETQCLIDIFGIVQAKQDSGKSWGDAIKLLLV